MSAPQYELRDEAWMILMPRQDGTTPKLVKALDGKIHFSESEAHKALEASEFKANFAVYRVEVIVKEQVKVPVVG
jgi:hypothetical protein